MEANDVHLDGFLAPWPTMRNDEEKKLRALDAGPGPLVVATLGRLLTAVFSRTTVKSTA
jgi:hypothetical protein